MTLGRKAVLVGKFLATAVFCLLSSAGFAAEPEKRTEAPSGVHEVRQGGYVEKVDPNVDYKDRLPRILPKEPAESIKTFHIVPGFRVEQVAAEPLICDPVDMTFDEHGRMYVADLITYAEKQQRGGIVLSSSRVSLLEDVDGDGKFDKSTVFADKLSWPTGLVCFNGGLFIATMPDVIYCRDTDGDGKADVREVIVSGFDDSSASACPNSLRWGLDGRIHGMTSLSGGLLRAVKWEQRGQGRKQELIQSRGRDFSFDPRTGDLRLESGGSQFGMTFDEWGRKFESSNSAPIEMVMYEDRYLARNPFLIAPSARVKAWTYANAVYRTSPIEPWRVLRTELRLKKVFSGPVEGGGTPAGYFTGACGVSIYQGHAASELQGNAFVAEGSGNLVHRMRLEPDGVGVKAYRTEEKKEFLTSDEIWFRPIQFADGPDGALYLADMYRQTYEHPDAIPPSARKHLDLLAGNDRGRIYRVVPEDFRQPKPVRLAEMPTAELVQLLAHPNGWHRHTARRLLFERQDSAAVVPLRKLTADSPSPLGRMHALYALASQKALTSEIVLARLDDPHPRVREHAVRLAECLEMGQAPNVLFGASPIFRLVDSPSVRERLYHLTGDPDMRVRYQLAFTLGEISGPRVTAALAQIVQQDVNDSWIRLAVLSSCFGRAGELLTQLSADLAWCRQSAAIAFLEQLAEQTGLQNQNDQIAHVLNLLESSAEKDATLAQSLVRGLSKGLAKSGSPLRARLKKGSASRSGQILAEMLAQAKNLAADSKRPLDERVPAIRSLAIASFEDASAVLGELLDSRQPQAVQTAALQTLSQFSEKAVADMIVEAWAGFSPSVQGEAAEAVFARQERLSVLLAALEDGRIRTSQLAPARIQFLQSHPDESIRQQAKRLLTRATVAPREQVVKAYQEALTLKGDATHGKALFKQHCAKCHQLEGVGYDIGLPLMTVKSRGPEGILMQIFDPNREVNPAYLDYVVVTTDGRTMTGMISAESATSITLMRPEAQSDTVLRTDIELLRSTGLSIMPEGLEQQVSKQDVADVIAYLLAIP